MTVDAFTSNGPPYSTQFEGSGEPLSIGTRAYSMVKASRLSVEMETEHVFLKVRGA